MCMYTQSVLALFDSMQVLVGEEALLKKLKTYERENEHLRKRLEDVRLPNYIHVYYRAVRSSQSHIFTSYFNLRQNKYMYMHALLVTEA